MPRSFLRKSLWVTVVASTVFTVIAIVPPGVAGAAPSPVATVDVHGSGTTPLAVDVSWPAPADASYAGARVVVTVGSGATSDPMDPSAVFSADVAAPATVTTVTDLLGGLTYTATVFGYAAAGDYATGASVTWAMPADIASAQAVGFDSGSGGRIEVHTGPVIAGSDVLCVVAEAPPPLTPAPPAICTPVGYASYPLSVIVAPGRSYGVTVFPYGQWAQGTSGPRLDVYGAPKTLGMIDIPDDPPYGPDLVMEAARSANSVELTWRYEENLGAFPTDLSGFYVYRAAGTAAPTATAAPIANVVVCTSQPCWGSEASYIATGLVANQPYTFSIRARDQGGHLSSPISITAAARVPGVYLTDNSTSEHRWRTQRTAGIQAFAVARGGAVHAAYTDSLVRPCSSNVFYSCSNVYYTWRTSGGRWSTPTKVGTGIPDTEVFVMMSASGRVALAWSSPRGPAYRVRWPGHGWSTTRYFAGAQYNTAGSLVALVAFAQDLRNGLHAVVRVNGDRLVYATNATGKWTTSIIPKPSRAHWDWAASPRLAADPVTGSIVLATTERGSAGLTIKLGRIARTAVAYGARFSVMAPDPEHDAMLSSLAGAGGRIAVAARVEDTRRLYLLTGTSPWRMGRWLRIPATGATAPCTSLAVGMASNRVIDLAWNHDDPTWSAARQGIFRTTYRFSATTHRWSFTRPQHRSNSHYDVGVGGILRDANGHLYIGYIRLGRSEVWAQ